MVLLADFSITWRDILDITLVSLLLYRVILMIRGTRAVTAVYGLIILLFAYFMSQELSLYTLNWLLENFLGSLFLVIIILFQQDIRNALSAMGARSFFRRKVVEEESFNEIIGAALYLAQRRIGALIVIEKNVPLGDMVGRGIRLNAKLTKELLVTVFYPNTPLHDGSVIIRNNEVVAAGCILPLTQRVQERRDYGTRHRAAMGITEESDAIAVVVSEERGAVSVALGGKLTAELDAARLKRVLRKALEK
ncbi:diadenylate cyclase CdaA [Oleidesulfovibrio sp.]|uniref:diadenylate cyclase CdaA n=1 Tax=Oleidesulfovibrio sp. TaxID=2909707 RepID=UPI003A865416